MKAIRMFRMMKLTVLASALMSLHASAQKTIETAADIKAVTVYLQGAELILRSGVQVPAGNSELVFTGLPQTVNATTVQVSANTDITILSAVFQLNYLHTRKENETVKTIRDSLDLIQNLLRKTQGQKSTAKGQMELLNANKDVTGDHTGLNMEQLTKMYEYYGSRMNELNNQVVDLEQKEKKLNEHLQRLQNQLNELNSRFSQPTGEVAVQVHSEAARTSTFELSFVVNNAGWSPAYDVRSKDVKSAVELNYKANVWQTTGTDWNDVKLRLSTGNPTVSATGPVLDPWYLNFGVVTYEDVLIRQGNRAQNMAMPEAQEQAVQADGLYESKSKSGAGYTSVVQTQLTAEFDITIPYDVPSDGKPHLIAIQDYQLPANYHYYTAPKLDADAFLVADISNWEDFNLLPGMVNIFFQGRYVGQSWLDTRITRDTLPVSLGRDKSIIVKREKVKDFSKPKTIGDNIRQSFAYTISIRNTKKEPVDIRVVDQVPISQNSKIEVTVDETGGASLDASTGKLYWNLNLAPNEEHKLQFSFTVKYPKDQVISGL